MKVGDKLYCYNSVDHEITTGKVYIITFYDIFSLRIIDDNGLVDWFIIDENDSHYHYYKRNFYTLKEYRKLKLKKIQDESR